MSENQKCFRCGAEKNQPLNPTATGNLLCQPCTLRLDPRNEIARKCPVDGANMSKRIVADSVVMDVCANCRGLWFDHGELEVIEKKSREMGWSEGFFTSIFLM